MLALIYQHHGSVMGYQKIDGPSRSFNLSTATFRNASSSLTIIQIPAVPLLIWFVRTAKCTQYLQLNEKLYIYIGIQKPTNSNRENLISSKFHRIFLSYSLCPCSVPVCSQHPNEEFPSLPRCCPLLIQHDSVGYPLNISLNIANENS